MPGIVVTGSSGLLGFRVMEVLCQTESARGLYHRRKPLAEFGQWVRVDLRDRVGTYRVLDDLRPSTIIHCAAYSDPVYCEHHPQEAHSLNLGAALYVAEWASRNACFLVHLSTDLVFDGRRGNYREEDAPHPISVYGWTKLAAELAVRGSKAPYAVVRTSLIYGKSMRGDRGADEKLVLSWEEGRATPLFVNEYRNPTPVGELAQVIIEIARRKGTGIWHVAGAECVSRFELGVKVAKIFGYSEDLLIPRTIEELPCIPPRTPNTTLNIDKIRQRLDFPFAPIETNLRREHGTLR
jgi:dTDP-4-dehydrorhamnose reductase